MELNRSNLISLVENTNAGDLMVIDHWPGERSCETGFFVMSPNVERQLREARSTAVLSSRLPKILDAHRVWFDAIRTVGANLSRTNEVILTCDGIASDRYCRRIAELFRVKCISLKLLTPEKLKKSLANKTCGHPTRLESIYFVTEEKPQADFLLGRIADTIYALSIKNKGNVEESLKHRLTQTDRQRTFVLHDDAMTKPAVRQQLISEGAIDWLLLNNVCEKPSEQSRNKSSRRFSLSEFEKSDYLIHWTRARCGPWPDQSEHDHLDDLIFGQSGGQHGDVFSLCRILASQRIIGSSDLIRASTPTVCFSDVSLSEVRDRTVFRKHLQRWDFLPYGIAIKRESLIERFECRPVIYGDEKVWASLSEADQPLFQLNKSSDNKIDWQQEREWRVVGDVDLRQIDLRDAVVFAGNENDLSKLSQLSSFDLIVI